jgi:hypothetical protein
VAKPPPPPQDVDDATLPEFYYDDARQMYWLVDDHGAFIRVNETSLKRRLKRLGFSAEGTKSVNSEVDDVVDDAQQQRSVRYAGPIAGHYVGMKVMAGRRVLVTESPTIIQSSDGDDSFLYDYVERLLGEDAIYYHAWVKLAREALIAQEFRRGQALVIAGPIGHGKSLLAQLTGKMLGSRVANPTQYLKGTTSFNAHMFGAELLLMDDAGGADDYQTRKAMGDGIKELVAGAYPQCHGKGATPITLEPFWRVLITVNDDHESLQVLPPIHGTTRDKIILLRTVDYAVDADTSDLNAYNAYGARLEAALPDYLGFLERWEVPEEYKKGRFGLVEYHDAEIMDKLKHFTPEERLRNMLIEAVQTDADQVLTSRAIERLLTEPGISPVEHEARALLRGPGSIGKYMARVCQVYPELALLGKREVVNHDGVKGSGSQTYVIRAKAAPDAPSEG